MAKSLLTLEKAIGHHGKIVKYYRCVVINPPRGWTQEQLAEAMSVSVRWVQEIEKMEYIQDIHRRKALAIILGIPAALLNIEKLERLSERSILPLHPTMLKCLRNDIRSRWQTYYSSSNQVTEEGLLEQIEVLEQLADDGKGDTKSIARLLSQSYQLAGTLARDDFKYSRAKKYFRDALHFAKDAQSPDLISTSMARHAIALLRQERVDDALFMYSDAVDLAKNAQPIVRGYIHSGFAEVLARKGLQGDCYRTLDLAESLMKAINLSGEDDLAFVHLTLQSLQDKRGECYVLSGQPRKGIDYLQKAARYLDRTLSREHCRLLFQQAEAFLVAGEPDTCVAYAIEGLQIARTLGSAGNINWASEIHEKLLASPWKNEPVIGKLGVAIVIR
jgi:transcriptional regulator with XRE-family HTH domain/sulfur relay (sulfurtransferase) complex TusBCD TusD component (DsrE family)